MLRSFLNSLKGIITKNSSAESSELTRIARNTIDPPTTNIQSPLSSTQIGSSGTPTSTSSTFQISSQTSPSSTATSMSRLGIKIPQSPKSTNSSDTYKSPQAQQLSQDNFVRVRIWASKLPSGNETLGINALLTQGNIGHATLETNKIYASIWPEVAARSFKEGYTPKYEDSPQTDALHEGGQPDYVITFYSLDSKAIESFFEKVKEAKEPWSLFGNKFQNNAFSCSSLTLTMLEVGGINNLADISRKIVSPTSNIVTSPNNLIRQLNLAKKAEELRYPESIDFKEKDANVGKQESFVVTFMAEKVNIVSSISSIASNNNTNNDLSSSINPTKRF